MGDGSQDRNAHDGAYREESAAITWSEVIGTDPSGNTVMAQAIKSADGRYAARIRVLVLGKFVPADADEVVPLGIFESLEQAKSAATQLAHSRLVPGR